MPTYWRSSAKKAARGKSHSVRSLAIAALIDGRKVAIIDADPEGTVIAWGKRRQNNAPTIVALGSQTVASQVKALEREGGSSRRNRHSSPRPAHHQYGGRGLDGLPHRDRRLSLRSSRPWRPWRR